MKPNGNKIERLLDQRILLLDGGMGTMVQQYRLGEEDYRAERFAGWERPLKGCNDLLALTRPQVVGEIHRKYLEAGSDIITTDSFNANALSLADYGLESFAYEINRAAAALARAAADEFTSRNPSRPRLVGGSIGPTSHSLTLASATDDAAVDFRRMSEAYSEQAAGLMDGGADLLVLETFFDTLNAKAAIRAIEELFEKRGRRLPLIVSGTLTSSGRTLSGQTVEAFYYSIAHARPLAVSLNCSFGASALMPYLEQLAAVAECRVAVYPNAGLPNLAGGYDQTPALFADDMAEYLRRGLLNLVGGCCGTTPAHIFELNRIVRDYTPRPLPQPRRITVLSGLEPLRIVPEANFVNVGERTNVAGSARFARLIREGGEQEALGIARAQVEAGAQMIDVCMDDAMIDSRAAMKRFLAQAGCDPAIARVPVMIDSSKWEVIEAGLETVQGKGAVNSLSLKEGEAEMLRRARIIRRMGAAAVVMLFDERGQADTYERKIEVARRIYTLLTDDGFPAEDILIDPNVLAVATGIEQHDRYALDFIRAVGWIKQNLPGVRVTGGVSNLSFAFRGQNAVREALHAVFLYHAVQAGMDMGIVNPQLLTVYDRIEPHLLELAEDVVLCRRPDAADRLTQYAAATVDDRKPEADRPAVDRRQLPLEQRIADAMLNGSADRIEEDAVEGYRTLGSPMAVIEQLLMPAMERVGELFGEGKMFLPQVVKSARVMKCAVAALTPYLDKSADQESDQRGRVLIATVKGDVHDIGKNIVGVVMSCNGYRIRDLGVMVPPERIADEAAAWCADAICLSGLITPSLDEMIAVCRELERRGMRTPVIIGGATTSELDTAVCIAPVYSGAVIHAANASSNPKILSMLCGAEREQYLARVRAAQQALREQHARNGQAGTPIPIDRARGDRRTKPVGQIVAPLHAGRMVFPDFDIADVEPLIDWNFFFPAWGIKGRWPELLDDPEKGAEARKLHRDALAMLARIREERLLHLQGAVGIFPAVSRGDDILVTDGRGRQVVLPMLRNQTAGERHLCLSDFIADAEAGTTDYIGCFALTAGLGVKQLTQKLRDQGDEYGAMIAKLLADRLAEAFTETIHSFVRRRMWGYETGEAPSSEQIVRGGYRGRRMAFGYPASPDHTLKETVFDLLGATMTTELKLTENYMIDPAETLCGLFFADAEYFRVGTIGSDQLDHYAARRGIAADRLRKFISTECR